MSEGLLHIVHQLESYLPENCGSCGTQLSPNNRAYWIKPGNLCRSCAAVLGGVRVDDATFMLMTRGHIVISYYKKGNGTWRLRVEVRSSSHLDCVCMRSTFGGKIARHGPIWKWNAASIKDLGRVGPIIMQHSPEIGTAIMKYVTQPTSEKRSVYCEALGSIIGRSVSLRDWVTIVEGD